jgi:tripartite-type tricarboxylate transporter receptor subunit TctC
MNNALRRVPRRTFATCIATLLLAASLSPAMAQGSAGGKAWPSSAIKIIVPYPPGGGTDTAARVIARKLQESLKQSVIVDNRPGGKSIIAYEAVLREPADGHTFLFNNSSHGIQAAYKKLPYDVVADFTPVSPIANSSVVFAVGPDSPAKTLAEFITHVRQNPGKVAFGSFGTGTSSHLYGEILNLSARIDMLHVAYKGSAPALSDLMGGHVQALFVDAVSAKPLAETGKIRALAITGTQRWKAYPNLPTFGELGYAELGKPGWWGFLASSKVPPQVVAHMAEELRKIVAMPDIAAKLSDIGAEAHSDTPANFALTVQEDVARWKRIVKDRNLSLE